MKLSQKLTLPPLRLPPWGRKSLPLTLPIGPSPPLGETAPADGVSRIGSLYSASLPADGPPGGASGPSGCATYRRMAQDPQIKACLATKKFAALSQGWTVRAASDAPDDEAVAAFVRDAFARMRGSVSDALFDLLDALTLGVSLAEIVYEIIPAGPYAGLVGLKALKSKDPCGFLFETDAYANVTALVGLDGRAYPPDKFLRYTYVPLYGGPWGQSDLRACYQPWLVKQQLLKWWAKYLEKFGLPTVVGSYASGGGYGADQQRELLSIVTQVHNESAVVLPSDMSLALLETARGQAAGFLECIEYLDRAIAKALLGQTLTTDGTGSGATYALGAVHQDVLGFYLAKLQRDLEETVMNAQLLPRLVAYNFGPGTACPTFHLGGLDDGRLEAAGHLISDLVTGKVIAPDEPWIRGYLGLPVG